MSACRHHDDMFPSMEAKITGLLIFLLGLERLQPKQRTSQTLSIDLCESRS